MTQIYLSCAKVMGRDQVPGKYIQGGLGRLRACLRQLWVAQRGSGSRRGGCCGRPTWRRRGPGGCNSTHRPRCGRARLGRSGQRREFGELDVEYLEACLLHLLHGLP